MTRFPNQSYYPDTEQTSHCHIPVKPSAGLGSDKCQLVWLDQKSNFELPHGKPAPYQFSLLSECVGSQLSPSWNWEYPYSDLCYWPCYMVISVWDVGMVDLAQQAERGWRTQFHLWAREKYTYHVINWPTVKLPIGAATLTFPGNPIWLLYIWCHNF